MMKTLRETPIDVLLVKKITKAMRVLFNSATNFNYYTYQLLVLKIMPIVIKSTKYHEDAGVKCVYHRMHILLQNGLRFLWMINKNPQSCTVT